MITYVIDGNNLIGKIGSLSKLGKKDKQATREKLVYMLENYFNKTKNKVVIHYDGFPGEAIKASKARIMYSEKKSADDTIKHFIEMSDNPRSLVVVTSDNNLAQFARVCGTKVITSEEFSVKFLQSKKKDDEESLIHGISTEEIKKMFNA